MNRTARTLLIQTGILRIASGLAHAFLRLPALRQELAAAQCLAWQGGQAPAAWVAGSLNPPFFGVIGGP